jgi:hypothetical protein
MAGTTANVLVGGASKVEIAAYLASKVVSLTYSDIGYTVGGVVIDPKVELYNVEVDQTLGILAAIPKKRDFAVKFRFAESTLDNLRLALSMPTSALVTSGTGGTLSITASAGEQYYQMRITGKGLGATGVRTVLLWRSVPKDIGTVIFKKDDMQPPEVTFQVCEDTSGTNTTATYGTINDA